MAKTYTSTVQLRCMKEHTCAACGTVYQYLMARKVVGTSRRSAEDATVKCRAAVERTKAREVDLQPCPACGLLQPDMIGQKRERSHRLTLIILAIVAVVILFVRLGDGLNAGPCTWLLTAITAVAALGYAAAEGVDRNRDLEGNRQRSAAAIEAGTVRVDPQKLAAARSAMLTDGPGRARGHWLLVGLALLAPVLAVAPEGVRLTRGWPANDAFYPPVIGPGDTSKVYMSEKIGSVKGYYRGSSSATFAGASAEGLPLETTTNQNDWGTTIYDVKDSEKESFHRPWVKVTMPTDPSLAGRQGGCAVHLTVEYPYVPPGESKFVTDSREMNETFPVKLATAGAGGQYQSLWWGLSGASVALLIVGGFALVWAAKRLRTPGTTTNVYPAA
jgi:hypothetical protein